MRLDRLITLSIVGPVRSFVGPRRELHRPGASRQLPILMYHSISDDPETGVSPYYRTCTPPRVFGEHMALLKSLGYVGVTVTEGLAWLNPTAPPPPSHSGPGPRQVSRPASAGSQLDGRCFPLPPSSVAVQNQNPIFPNATPVALTFDDGFQDFASSAVPILQQHGFSATMYLPTAYVADDQAGAVNSKARKSPPEAFKGRPLLDWRQVRELHAAGIEFGSHTVNHPALYGLDWPEIESEIRDSKSAIEQRLGTSVPAFAYPFAFPQSDRAYAVRLQDLLRSAGYRSCVTTAVGRARPDGNVFELPRLPVNSGDDAALFCGKLAGHYDWLALPQVLVKTVKQAIRPGRRHLMAPQPAPTVLDQ